MIFGSRVEQAREFRGLTQSELADLLGISQVAIARIENGSLQPALSTMAQLALHLGFPESFFRRDAPGHFALGTLEFRARASISARVKKQAHQYASIMFEVAIRLAQRLRMPQMVMPSRLDADPETAAKMLRSILGFSPNAPIKNVVESLERSGVFVLALPTMFDDCDGFSNRAVANDSIVPVVCLSAAIPADRTRFTAMHEIGELTLADMPPGRERERKAHRFASAFLMPAEAMKRDLIPPLTLSDFATIKHRYGVSLQAAIVRSRELEIISDARYSSLFRQLSTKGMRINEGPQPPAERPRAFRKMAEILYGDPIDFRRLGEELCIDPLLLRQVLGVHATKPGGGIAPKNLGLAPVVQLDSKGRNANKTVEYEEVAE